MAKCKKCGSQNVTLRKSWKLQGGIHGKVFRIDLYDCKTCGKTSRTATPI